MTRIFLAFALVISAPVFAATGFQLQGRSCAALLDGSHLEMQITHLDQMQDLAIVYEVSPDSQKRELGRFKVAPTLPETPDAKYSYYRGTDTGFELKLYREEWECPEGKCNAVFKWADLGNGIPVHMFAEASGLTEPTGISIESILKKTPLEAHGFLKELLAAKSLPASAILVDYQSSERSREINKTLHTISPDDFPTREAWRQALIDRKRDLAAPPASLVRFMDSLQTQGLSFKLMPMITKIMLGGPTEVVMQVLARNEVFSVIPGNIPLEAPDTRVTPIENMPKSQPVAESSEHLASSKDGLIPEKVKALIKEASKAHGSENFIHDVEALPDDAEFTLKVYYEASTNDEPNAVAMEKDLPKWIVEYSMSLGLSEGPKELRAIATAFGAKIKTLQKYGVEIVKNKGATPNLGVFLVKGSKRNLLQALEEALPDAIVEPIVKASRHGMGAMDPNASNRARPGRSKVKLSAKVESELQKSPDSLKLILVILKTSRNGKFDKSKLDSLFKHFEDLGIRVYGKGDPTPKIAIEGDGAVLLKALLSSPKGIKEVVLVDAENVDLIPGDAFVARNTMADKTPVALKGRVLRRVLNPGSKSELEGVVLLVDGREYVIEREDNPNNGFDPEFRALAGKFVSISGTVWRGRILVKSYAVEERN